MKQTVIQIIIPWYSNESSHICPSIKHL